MVLLKCSTFLTWLQLWIACLLLLFQGIRSQAQSFAILCLKELTTDRLQINLTSPSMTSSNTQESCPTDMCSSQGAVTLISSDAFLAFNILNKVPVLEHNIFMRFRTRYCFYFQLWLSVVSQSAFLWWILCYSLHKLSNQAPSVKSRLNGLFYSSAQ